MSKPPESAVNPAPLPSGENPKDPALMQETVKLVRLYQQLRSKEVRAALMSVVEALVAGQEAARESDEKS